MLADRLADGKKLMPPIDVGMEIYPCGRLLTMPAVPVMRMVMIMVIVMRLITTGKGGDCQAGQKDDAEDVLKRFFHGRVLYLESLKPCQDIFRW